MSSLAAAGLYSALLALLFPSAATSMRILSNATSTSPLSAGDSHRLYARDAWDDYDSVLQSFLAQPTCSPDSGGAPSSGDILIAVASYIPPADTDAWNRLVNNYSPTKMPILIANAVNGPDFTPDPSWQDVVTRGTNSGKIVLGYVRTGYLGQNLPTTLPIATRLGSTNLADWVAQIEEDVDSWYRLYTDIGGIFFDEGWPQCGPDNIYHDVYKYVNDYAKRRHPGAYTVLNPGSTIDSCFEDTMDTLLSFEQPFEVYTTSYQANTWTPKDPRKLWHIVYNVPESAIAQVASLARLRGAGFLQLTDDTVPNPYDTLPDDEYMQAQIAQASGGTVLNSPASDWPSGPSAGAVGSVSISFWDYSSVILVWGGVSGAFGYNIYVNAQLSASVPATMTSVTIGGLQPGTNYAFFIRVIGGGGIEGPQSPTSQISTLALPAGTTIDNLSSSSSVSSSTFQADVLVPYAFVRVFIWQLQDCFLSSSPGWPILFGSDGHYVCATHMLENGFLYEYSGGFTPGVNAPFSWTQIASGIEPIVSNRYTNQWTLPLGTGDVDTSKFVIQGQGYNPTTNIIQPDASAYDCKGSSLCTVDLGAACDAAQFNIVFSKIYTNQGDSAGTGECFEGCGIFIQGPGVCTITGFELYSAYEQIRAVPACEACGSWHRADGCLVTINFVSGC